MSFGRDYPEDYTTVVIGFTTHDSNGAPVAPLTGYEAADITIYKNGATAKSTTNGITMTSPLNSKTGLHAVIIDTSNDTGDSGFWTTGGGSHYLVVLDPDTETVNGQTTRKVIGDFTIAVSPVNWGRVSAPTTTVGLTGTTIATTQTIATVTNQLTAGAIAAGVWQDTTAGDFTVNASIGKSVMNGVTLGTGLTVNDLTTKTGFTLSQSFPTNFSSLGITAGGHITTVDTTTTVTNQLTAAAIATGVWTDTTASDFTTSLSVGKSIMNGVTLGTGLTVNAVTGITASDIGNIKTKTDFLPSATAGSAGGVFIAGTNAATTVTSSFTTTFTGNLTGNVGGNVAGNVGGNVSGTINGLTAAALADFFDTDSGTTFGSAIAGSVVKEIVDNVAGSTFTVQDIVDGVWDEPLADHLDAGSTGEALDAASSGGSAPTAADIADAVWDEDATGHQTQGTFGQAIGDPGADTDTIYALVSTNLDDTVSSRATQTSVDDLPTNAELATALGTADDAVLAAVAALLIPTADENADALLDRADAIEVGLTPRQAMRLSAAADGGKLSGGGTVTNTIRNAVADDTDRIIATVDEDGNRTAITYDLD